MLAFAAFNPRAIAWRELSARLAKAQYIRRVTVLSVEGSHTLSGKAG